MRLAHTLERLTSTLVPGQVYRRSDFVEMSSNVDRHLALLLKQGVLKKLFQGFYITPYVTAFGEGLPAEDSLLRAFLKDDRFVVYSPSQFNALGLGTTQLYNRRVVFNVKRIGEIPLGGRIYTFRRWREAPKSLTKEFFVVEFLNQLNELVEDQEAALSRLQSKLGEFDQDKLKDAISRYGTLSAKKRLAKLMKKRDQEQSR